MRTALGPPPLTPAVPRTPVYKRGIPSGFLAALIVLCYIFVPMGIMGVVLLGADFLLPALAAVFMLIVGSRRIYQRVQEKTVRRELSEIYGQDFGRRPLVTLNVPYKGNIDVAIMQSDRDTLRLYGDTLPCTLPKDRIRKVRYYRFPTRLSPQVEIDWEAENDVQTLVLTPKGAMSRRQANEVVDSIRLMIEYGQGQLPVPFPYLPPTD